VAINPCSRNRLNSPLFPLRLAREVRTWLNRPGNAASAWSSTEAHSRVEAYGHLYSGEAGTGSYRPSMGSKNPATPPRKKTRHEPQLRSSTSSAFPDRIAKGYMASLPVRRLSGDFHLPGNAIT
jgi:hypothetical protein